MLLLTILIIFSFFIFRSQLIFSSLLHIYISSACNLSISAFRKVHVSHLQIPYITTDHTSTFFTSLLRLFVSNSFLMLNASFASAILALTSFRLLPSPVINDPRYLKLATCYTFTSSITMLTIPPPSLLTTMPLFFDHSFSC